MKNKVLLGMLIGFIILSGIAIMCGTIFVVREVEIVDSSAVLSIKERATIAEKTGLTGKNILFSINQCQIKNQVQTYNPQLKVQKIYTEFPNRVVISVRERVAVYSDHNNYYDADMCVVSGNRTGNYVDIAEAGLALGKQDIGQAVSGTSARDQRKIEQLRTVATYLFPKFSERRGWQISYDDSPETVGANRLCLSINLANGTIFTLRLSPEQDFAKALAFTYKAYTKRGSDEYLAFYGTNNKLVIYLANQKEVIYEK